MTDSDDELYRRFIESVRRSALVEHLESELGLPARWSTFIVAEDGWSFIIKSHALLEAAANRTLNRAIGRPELSELIGRLEMSGQATGKVTALVQLGVLDSESKRFLSKLSELRNAFVHDVRNTTQTISSYLATLSESDLKGFEKAFCWGIRDWRTTDLRTLGDGSEEESFFFVLAASSWEKGVHALAIWLGVLFILRRLHLAFATEETRQHERELLLEAAKGIANEPA